MNVSRAVPLRLARLLPLLALSLVTLQAQSNYATPYKFTTFAGTAGTGSTDGTGSAARFNNPNGVASDSAGNLYVADTFNNTIRKITPVGVVTTLAGTAGLGGAADGSGSDARFYWPSGIAVDGAGNVYVADSVNDIIRKITPAGVVTTIAGSVLSPGYADGTGVYARFYSPSAIAVDGAGNLYVADTLNHAIRKITPGGDVSTLAGLANNSGSSDGTGSAARFTAPQGIAVDGDGNVYVADTGNGTIRQITPGGVVSTLAGTTGVAGSADGTGSAAQFNNPEGVVIDAAGNLFVADNLNYTIRKIAPGGVVTTFAGAVSAFFPSGAGSDDGTGSVARFFNPTGVTVDASGNIYVADAGNEAIRKITPAAVVTTVAGRSSYGAEDGPGTNARFYLPQAIAVDGANNLYVADTDNNVIRKITAAGAVTTLAGSAQSPGSADGTGPAAQFYHPCALAVDASGYVYVADSLNGTIRKITPEGSVTTLAGSPGGYGSNDGTGAAALFSYPRGIAVDSAGNVYVSDTTNATIRKITPGGTVTTLAGLAGSTGLVNGTGSAARFTNPYGLVMDDAGNVLVADSSNGAIRKVTPAGVVTTLAGHPGSTEHDGPLSSALFNYPRGLARDDAGNLYVSDYVGATIRKISPQGLVTTLAGLLHTTGQSDGVGQAALFNLPQGLAVDGAGNLYVADSSNSTIRQGVPVTPRDFNADHQPDIVWQNLSSGDRGFWLMTGAAFASWVDLGYVSTDWRLAAVADFNRDGQPDFLWENTVTGDRGFWLMNGTAFATWVDLGYISTDWRMAAAADFNFDGQPDILWENTVTGDRGIWLMHGTGFVTWQDIGYVSTDWRIAGAGDFNGDGQTDIVWENTVTGDRGFWLMSGPNYVSWVDLGYVSTDWHIAAVADFNADGQPDFLWENMSTGDRGFWLMNGTAYANWVDLGYVSTDWRIAR